MSLRSLAQRHPAAAAVLLAAGQFVLTVAILKIGIQFVPRESFGAVKLAAFASTVFFPLLAVHVLGLWPRAGFNLHAVRPAPIFVAALSVGAIFLAFGINPAARPSFAGEALLQFANAFGEELLFRGAIFALLLSLPKWKAFVLNGLLFGAMHLIHGFMEGNWHAALVQASVTAVAGTMFTAVRDRSGSLWLAIVLHMFVNLCMIYSNLAPQSGQALMFAVERLANVIEVVLVCYVLVTERRRLAAMPSAAAAR